MGRFATTIFSATQRCNVATMLQPFETMSQQCCNAVLRLKSLLQIVSCNISFTDVPLAISDTWLRARKKLEFKLVLWASSSHILFACGPLFSSQLMILGTLSNDHDDDDNNGKKKIGFMSKTTALHISQTSTARLRLETSQCDVLWRTWSYYNNFSLLYLNMDKALKNSTPGKVAYI